MKSNKTAQKHRLLLIYLDMPT